MSIAMGTLQNNEVIKLYFYITKTFHYHREKFLTNEVNSFIKKNVKHDGV